MGSGSREDWAFGPVALFLKESPQGIMESMALNTKYFKKSGIRPRASEATVLDRALYRKAASAESVQSRPNPSKGLGVGSGEWE